MDQTQAYNGSLTAEQFLYYEIRIASKFYLEEKPVEKAVEIIKRDNLFQYPTERQVSRLTRACYKRLDALDNRRLAEEIAVAPNEIAKQINLYAMMRYNRLVWEFMTQVSMKTSSRLCSRLWMRLSIFKRKSLSSMICCI